MEVEYMTEDESNRVKSYIVGAGYNITSLAKAINMSREMLSNRISGKVDFGRTEMNKIATVLKSSTTEIFFGK